MEELMESYASGNGLLILLDGLDEVGSANYDIARQEILQLSGVMSNLGGRNCIVLTMRTQFHQQVRHDFDVLFPPTYFIKPFDGDDIYRFLTLWPHYGGERDAETIRIFNQLHDRPTLADMCRNPLVLAMYVNNDQAGSGVLVPETRTAFYGQVVEELLVDRRGRQLAMKKRTVIREQRESLLGRLAFENLLDESSSANSIPWDSAIAAVKDAFRCKTDQTAVARLKEVCTETGLLSIERAEESLRFIHLTFEEFLAAAEARHRGREGWEYVIDSYARFQKSSDVQVRSRLVEVLPFLLGLLARADRAEALTRLAPIASYDVLGRCFLETKAYDQPSWSGYVSSESQRIRRTERSARDESWTRRLHLFSVVLKDEEEWGIAYGVREGRNLGTVLREMIELGRGDVIEVLSGSSALDPTITFRIADELGIDLLSEHPQVIRNGISSPPFRATVAARVEKDPSLLGSWSEIVAGSCLSNISTAALLLHEDPGKALQDQVDVLSRRDKWFRRDRRARDGDPGLLGNDPFRPSLFAYSLSLVMNANGFTRGPSFGALNRRFRGVRPSGQLVSESVLRALCGAPGALGVAVWSLLWWRSDDPSFLSFAQHHNLAIGLSMAAIIYLTAGFLGLPRQRWVLYYYLVNPEARLPGWLRADGWLLLNTPSRMLAGILYAPVRAAVMQPSSRRQRRGWGGPPRYA
jgi:hypothetical protein